MIRLTRFILIIVLAFGWMGSLSIGDPDVDLKQARRFQEQVVKVAEKALPAFVFVGGGSGVIISEDGYILTNHHVARNTRRWRVFLAGGKSHYARRVGFDPRGDISLLKIRFI